MAVAAKAATKQWPRMCASYWLHAGPALAGARGDDLGRLGRSLPSLSTHAKLARRTNESPSKEAVHLAVGRCLEVVWRLA
jgi:hypothetical protein